MNETDNTMKNNDVKQPSGVLGKLRSLLSGEEQRLEQVAAETEARRSKLQALESEYNHLLALRDGDPNPNILASPNGLKDRLRIADQTFEDYKARRAQLANSLHHDWWGNYDVVKRYPESGYAALLALDAAIKDYPNARKVLVDELAALEQRITEFERKLDQA